MLQELAAFLGESVSIWHVPNEGQGDHQWRIWSGPAQGGSGGELGHSSTLADALVAAFTEVARGRVDGRRV